MIMRTDYDALLPKGVLFNLKQIQEMGLVKISMMKKLISKNEIEVVKIGNKLHLARTEIIRFLEENTISILNIQEVH
jgi:hypothetical protein